MSFLLGDTGGGPPRRRRRYAALALAIGAVALLLYARLRPVDVRAVRVMRGRAVEAVYATGTLEPVQRRAVRARVAGLLVALSVREGDRVEKGALLGRVDPGALTAELVRGRAELRAAEAQGGLDAPRLATLRAQADSIVADLRFAEDDRERVRKLLAQSSASRSDLERAEARASQLAATLAAKRAELRASAIELTVTTSRSRAQLDSALAKLSETELRAPIAGVVLSRAAEPGEVVQREQVVLKIGDPSALELEALVDEGDLARIVDGDHGSRVAARFYALSERPLGGHVVQIFPEALRDRKAFLVKIALDEVPAALRVGMSAEVNIVTAETEGVLVASTSALEGKQVWVVRGGVAHAVAVERGLGDLLRTELRTGVTDGDLLVTEGAARLRDGQRVRVTIDEDDASRPQPKVRR